MRFRFIEDRRVDYPVRVMCDVLGVAPAGYYAWCTRPESQRSIANRNLLSEVRRVHRDNRGRYGSPRIHAELRGRGVSRGRVERLMRRHGIRAILARAWHPRTTEESFFHTLKTEHVHHCHYAHGRRLSAISLPSSKASTIEPDSIRASATSVRSAWS